MFRIADDLSKSLVNNAVLATESYCPNDFGAFTNIAREQAKRTGMANRTGPIDFSHAYATIGMRPDSESASYVCLIHPFGNQVYAANLLAKPFGIRRAPSKWVRVLAFTQFRALGLFRLIMAAYVGDVFSVETAE